MAVAAFMTCTMIRQPDPFVTVRVSPFIMRRKAGHMRTLRLKVKPGSREEGLTELDDGTWLARVKAPPVDGKANTAVIALVAQHFGLRKAQVHIKSGASGRSKLVQLED
jgi:uncharacterized protein (TIGR00251 family)